MGDRWYSAASYADLLSAGTAYRAIEAFLIGRDRIVVDNPDVACYRLMYQDPRDPKIVVVVIADDPPPLTTEQLARVDVELFRAGQREFPPSGVLDALYDDWMGKRGQDAPIVEHGRWASIQYTP